MLCRCICWFDWYSLCYIFHYLGLFGAIDSDLCLIIGLGILFLCYLCFCVLFVVDYWQVFCDGVIIFVKFFFLLFMYFLCHFHGVYSLFVFFWWEVKLQLEWDAEKFVLCPWYCLSECCVVRFYYGFKSFLVVCEDLWIDSKFYYVADLPYFLCYFFDCLDA